MTTPTIHCTRCNDWGYVAYPDGPCPCHCAAGAYVRQHGTGSVKTPAAIEQIAAIRDGRKVA